MTALRVGAVGCGALTQKSVLPHLAQDDARATAEVVAVCDLDGQRASAVAHRFGMGRPYSSYEEMLQHPGLEAVLIITPNQLHFSQAMAAIAAGKHVYVQKTLTMSVAQADALITAADLANVVVVASPGQMLLPAWQEIKREIQRGTIGTLFWALSTNAWIGHENESFRDGSTVDPTWYYTAGGGPMYDMAVYSLHALTGILGSARAVTAMSGIAMPERSWGDRRITVETDDNTVLLIDFGGTMAVAGGHYCTDGPVLVSGHVGIYGSHGAIEVDRFEPESIYPSEFVVRKVGNETRTVAMSPLGHIGAAHHSILEPHVWVDIRHFLECAAQGKRPIANASHARHVIEIIEKGYIAAKTGVTQQLATTL